MSLVYLLLIMVPLRADTVAMRAVFDVLFPSTPYKRMVVTCIQLQGALAKFGTHTDSHDTDSYEALIIGHLDSLERSVHALTTERLKCRMQDLDYALDVLENVALQAAKMEDAQYGEHSIVAKIMGIRNAMDRLL